ncbi:MAG TPA: NUDIX hydrolase [Candidatus Saccharimonadia bacterium]|nr:NUDIX hydrolase [Candidatus Saccharimonadia bacterium]
MQRLWRYVGIAIFWIAWPIFWLALPHTRRTRILIIHTKKILVVKTWISNGKWSLPGGGLHKHEDAGHGVLRELNEETGISLRLDQIEPLAKNTYQDTGLRFTCHYYSAALIKEPPLHPQQLEITELKWVDPASLNRDNAGLDVLSAIDAYAESKS